MAEQRPPAEMAQPEPLSVLWRLFSAPQTLLVLMGLLVLTLTLGAWVPQIPPYASSDPQAWLAAQPGLFGQENWLVRTLGLYDLYQTAWFRLLLVLTGVALFVRAVDAAELAWRVTARQGRAAALPPSWQSSLPVRQLAFSLPVAETGARIEEHLAQQGYRHTAVPASPLATLIISHRGLALWVRPAGYAAVLLALLGLFVAVSWGWQDDPVQLLPGESRPVGHGTALGFRLEGFRLQLDNRGQLAGYESDITWLEGQAELGPEVVGIGRPARQGGLALHQAGFVPAVRIKAQDAAGLPQRLEGSSPEAGSGEEVFIRFSLPEDQPLVFFPRLERFLALTFEPQCDLGRPAVHIDLLDEAGANRERLGSLSSSGTLPFGEGRLNVELAYVPILRLESRPAMGPALAVALLALLALALALVLPPRLAWLTLLPGGEKRSAIWVTALAGAGQREWLAQLAEGLEGALQDGD
jgi:hypothetical protein